MRQRCVATHSKSDGLDWHACWPSTVSFWSFLFLSNLQRLFCCPLQVFWFRARRPPSSVNTDSHTHIHTHRARRPHLSKLGRWRDQSGWGPGGWGPGVLSLEECCLYLKAHISRTATNNQGPHRLPILTASRVLLSLQSFHTCFLKLCKSSVCFQLHLLHCLNLSHFPPNFIPSITCPCLPACHAPSLCLLYVFWQPNICFQQTRQQQNSEGQLWRMGLF